MDLVLVFNKSTLAVLYYLFVPELIKTHWYFASEPFQRLNLHHVLIFPLNSPLSPSMVDALIVLWISGIAGISLSFPFLEVSQASLEQPGWGEGVLAHGRGLELEDLPTQTILWLHDSQDPTVALRKHHSICHQMPHSLKFCQHHPDVLSSSVTTASCSSPDFVHRPLHLYHNNLLFSIPKIISLEQGLPFLSPVFVQDLVNLGPVHDLSPSWYHTVNSDRKEL